MGCSASFSSKSFTSSNHLLTPKSGESDCLWASGQNAPYPDVQDQCVPLLSPGVADIGAVGFGSTTDPNGIWGYCFKGDSGAGDCTAWFRPWCIGDEGPVLNEAIS
jgi:hypothetical protein